VQSLARNEHLEYSHIPATIMTNSDDINETNKLPKSDVCSLTVLSLIGFIDAVSYMSVAPSLIFYVNSLEGTKEQYGVIMSIFSFSSFLMKPVYGKWVDSTGNKYKIPFIASFSTAMFGHLIYFVAILLPTSSNSGYNMGVMALVLGRFFAGMGAANNALGFSYIATVIPHDRQTTINVLLSMTRIVGMTFGPFVNMFLGKIDTEMHLPGTNLTIPLNPYNSVGLFLAMGQLLVLSIALVFFNEPDSAKKKDMISNGSKAGMTQFWEVISCVEILVPMLIIFVINCNFQLVETAFPPATAHGLGWGPVQTSTVMGINAFMMFFLMAFVMLLSMKKVSDTLLVLIGSLLGMAGGYLMWDLWKFQAPVWHFVLPIVISVAGFPFIASSNRSNFTKAVKSKPELESAQSMMQAIMSMGASVGGFIAPSFVATFVMRSPEDVNSNKDKRELTLFALYVPISSALCILGLWYESVVSKHNSKKAQEEEGLLASEGTSLVQKSREKHRSSVIEIKQEFSRRNECNRRTSTELMGVACPFENSDEMKIRDELWHQKKEWQEIHNMSTMEEDTQQ
jgi:MFS family permease